jgi:muramoyltetrapeptide carboxypeptidase
MAFFQQRKVAREASRGGRPSSVAPGDGVSIVAPASSAKIEVAQKGLQLLRDYGYQPHLGKNAFQKGPLYFAGSTAQRRDDLQAAFADEKSSFLMSLRGGYGSNYLLESLDLELIRRHPKPFFGYSDLTALQLYLLDKISLPAFHGPMLAADFAQPNGVHRASFDAALQGKPYQLGAAEGLRRLRGGVAAQPVRGTLYGGCLSIITAMLGTSYAPRTEGKLLFLEDVGVKPYQIDRMLWQMRQAGKFEGVRGIIFGEMPDCHSPGAHADLLEEVILSVFADLDVPIVIGLRSGHVTQQNVTLTMGVEAELNFESGVQLKLLEAAVG